jgi:hypothetical protein
MPPKGSQDAKIQKMKERFAQLDANGDGNLDEQELGVLLRKGNPNFTDAEIKNLYNACDANHDGRVSFDEFVSFIYKQERTTAGRHMVNAADTATAEDGSEGDWSACREVFTAFAGKDMDGREFAKFCKDNSLVGHGMAKTDVDLIFSKVVPKGQRRMNFAMFQNACREIAKKRSQSNGDIQRLVSSSAGPTLTGTKTDAVRFHDDKSTYTGAHVHNEAHAGVNAGAALGRHEALAAQREGAIHGSAAEADWAACEDVYYKFAPEGKLEGRDFKKLCEDTSGLLGRGFTKNDVDLVFAKFKPKSSKAIDFEAFKDCVREIAVKRGQAPADVQEIVSRSGGPHVHATATDAVRFHDDKSTYTGAHAEVHGRGGHDDGRHERLAAEHKKLEEADESEHQWTQCTDVFNLFVPADKSGLESRDFNKLCNDAGLFDRNFTKNDVDIVFTASVPKGTRILDATMFQSAVRQIATKKKMSTANVQSIVERCQGPHSNATQADAVRFHDDKTTYTGMHAE